MTNEQIEAAKTRLMEFLADMENEVSCVTQEAEDDILALCEAARPEHPEQQAALEEAQSLLASATDLLNSWAREFAVAEARDERDIKAVIIRLWDESAKWHWRANDERRD